MTTSLAEVFAKRSAWRVLSVLLEAPFVPHRQAEIARALAIPEASVQRGLRALMTAGLIKRKRSQYAADIGQEAVRYLWLLLQTDRKRQLPAALVNALSVVIERDGVAGDVVILFGSWARGVAEPGTSDVDVAIFRRGGEAPAHMSRRIFEGGYRFELHVLARGELESPLGSVALDALLNGVPITKGGAVYDALLRIRSFPKTFLIRRLEQAQTSLDRSRRHGPDSEAREFFSVQGERIIAQVRSIIEHGRTISWRESPRQEPTSDMIAALRERLAREGDQIWLT